MCIEQSVGRSPVAHLAFGKDLSSGWRWFMQLARAMDGITLWGAVPMEEWSEVPCLRGRTAVEADVAAGRAVFVIQGNDHHGPIPMSLPHLAYLERSDGSAVLVIVIQAEKAGDKNYIGYRLLDAGNGIALMDDLVFVNEMGEPVEPHV